MKNQNSIYRAAKNEIIWTCAELKGENDKTARRMILNDLLDKLSRDIRDEVFHDRLTEKRGEMFINWLTNYTIKRHTK